MAVSCTHVQLGSFTDRITSTVITEHLEEGDGLSSKLFATFSTLTVTEMYENLRLI